MNCMCRKLKGCVDVWLLPSSLGTCQTMKYIWPVDTWICYVVWSKRGEYLRITCQCILYLCMRIKYAWSVEHVIAEKDKEVCIKTYKLHVLC